MRLKLDRKLTLILLTILVVLGFITFWFWRGAIFSKEILKLEILGPSSVKMGEEVSYVVTYKNNGNFTLERPRLIFELPDGSLTEDSKTRFSKDLEDVYPGQEQSVAFKGRLLGKEGDVKIAHAWLSYTPHNLSARYESHTTKTTKIDSVPITLTFDVNSKVEKGKEINFSINYFSNVNYPLENLSIKIDPMEGLELKSSDPVSLDNAEWKLETLLKGQGRKINIKGVVTTEAGDRVTLSARLGMWQDGIFVVIKEASQEIEVIQPQLLISQQINNSVNYVASPGEKLNYQIFLKNIGSTPFNSIIAVVRLDGAAFDFSTTKSSEGNVNFSDNTIIFDAEKVLKLVRLSARQEVGLSFEVTLKNTLDVSSGNVVVKNRVEVLDINQEFVTKINSKIDFSQKAYHQNINTIENFGPTPPKVGEATSYAIVWSVKNSFNDVKNVRVKATLPQNVSLVDSMFPESQASHFSFDSNSREIIWSAGNLSSGALNSLTFQVVITPSVFQVGNTAQLIGQATVFAEDEFTNATIHKTVDGVDTRLPDDSDNSGGGIVIQ